MTPPPDIASLEDGFAAAERDARALVDGLSEERGGWRAAADSWTVAECLDHLAISNRSYLRAMEPIAEHGRTQGQGRRGPARPGLLGGWFARSLEPPVRPPIRFRAPRAIRPRPDLSLMDGAAQFFASQDEIRAFIGRYAETDLARLRFPNPFIRGVRFSLATGLHVLAAHERRHLWQGWNTRRAAERALL